MSLRVVLFFKCGKMSVEKESGRINLMSEDVDSPSNRRQRALAAWSIFYTVQIMLSFYRACLKELRSLFLLTSGRLYYILWDI